MPIRISTKMLFHSFLKSIDNINTEYLQYYAKDPQYCLAGIILILDIFYKQRHCRPPEPQIFENRSNLASNCRASNRKFLATLSFQIVILSNFRQFFQFLLVFQKLSNNLATLSLNSKNT